MRQAGKCNSQRGRQGNEKENRGSRDAVYCTWELGYLYVLGYMVMVVWLRGQMDVCMKAVRYEGG